MEYVNLGPSGLKVSRLCLGCMSYGDTSKGWHGDWVLSEDESRPFIREAVEDMHLPGDEDKRSAHRWLGEWFDKREVTLDVARERVHQWREAGDRDRLRACLIEQEMFKELPVVIL